MPEELVALDELLNEIRDRVSDRARTKDVRVVVVGVPQEVVVSRARVVSVVSTLLGGAIDSVGRAARVAVTAQEVEGELVFAVFAAGGGAPPAGGIDHAAVEAADGLGGRVWTTQQTDGTLSLFTLPVAIH